MGVFAAEPIADFMAVTCTAIIFYFQFRASLRKIDEKEKKDTLELFGKMLDLKFESEELIEKADELIERCEIDTKKEEEK